MTKQTNKDLPYRMISVAIVAAATVIVWSIVWFLKEVR